MKRLPNSMIAILLYLTLLYNLERITVNDVPLIDIKGFVYALVIITIIAVLKLKATRKLSLSMLIIITSILYIAGKFIIFLYWTNWNENSIYLIVTEVAMIWLGVVLSYRAGTYLEDFESAIKNISFPDFDRTTDLHETIDDIQTEIYRSRRYKHPLTMVVIEPETFPMNMDISIAIREVQNSMFERYFTVNMIRAIRNNLRVLDMIVDIDKGKRFAILYPETNREKAMILLRRIYEITEKMGITIRSGMASFPENAITFEQLLKRSIEDLGSIDFPKVNISEEDDTQEEKLAEN